MNQQLTDIVDLSGRPLGQRALKKRRQLMDAAVELFRHKSLRDLRVVDIARAVGTSPATFYQYFKDVEDVALQLAEEATAQMPSLLVAFDGDWRGEAGLEKAREVVDAFIRYWDEHGPVLRIRNTAADEGDPRFLAIRSRAITPLLASMEKAMASKSVDGKFRPLAAAVAMGAMLDRLSAYHHQLESISLSREDIVETCAHILQQTLSA